ncbi:conserved hypothetical protein [Methanosalsum zhilinae DSM 4017]|uniref:von Willebrand factor type A n=1 Tax=Methanosalsum zhilinae (strain DSM 4017 / NBRC 107636 / OCM 62 / WeN5) TaxID=679901 RepID=F7XQK3_METZD|nr:hypothetical protein [Methanosalsum zhilinae]AEH60506.1 conserved hypothetical protein [Methanosalsum zhilinae DSM 4017]
MISFGNPDMLWLIVPVVIAGLYLYIRGTRTKLIITRIIIISLLIVALASPQVLMTQTISDENPNIVIISDETESMNIFREGTGDRIYESLAVNTPTTLMRLTGERTAIGDAIIQHSRGDNQIVLISDGNNNHGKSIEEALEFAEGTGTIVHYVKPELERNDISVEIRGEKTVFVDNENIFDIVVSQAGNEQIRYHLEVYHGDTLIRSGTFDQSERKKTVTRVSRTFRELGAHQIEVRVTPVGMDSNSINNRFYKSIYVIPKPQIQLITDDTSAPLSQILLNLYDVSVRKDLDNLDRRKALVIDNQHINSLSSADIQKIERYVTDGGGLFVVGGDRSFNYGDYLDSSFERILPVISEPTEYKGGRNVVIMLDISASAIVHHDGLIMETILSNAISLLRDEDLRDANVGVIAFGSEGIDVSNGFVYLGVPSNIDVLESRIKDLSAGPDTDLDEGLKIALDWIDEDIEEMDIIILSDGGIEDTYQPSLSLAQEINEKGGNFYFFHIRSSVPSQIDHRTNVYYSESLMANVDGHHQFIDFGERINIEFEELEDPPERDEEAFLDTFPLIEFNPNHFITRNTDLSANITGFNDITPKVAADRVVLTVTGKPVLTTWRYGLGRVAVLSTDNGYGNGNIWASEIYSGENARIISSTVNWAIGDPFEEEGAVLEGDDTWLGTPTTLELTMYEEGAIPELTFRGETLELSMTGRNTYETTINPDRIGVHHVSGYPIAVNYPLEYRDVGINEKMPELIRRHGGNVYTENEARGLLLQDTREMSERTVTQPVDYKMYLILAALILFLADVLIRRIREIQEMKNIKD